MDAKTDESHDAVAGQVERSVRHAAPKRHSVAMWGNLIVAQAWSAACYVRPGWFPAAVSLVSILIAALILYEDKITAAIAARAEDEHA
jgi:hypothetical protein